MTAAPPFVQTIAEIVHHEPVSSRYFLLRLKCPEIAARARPGQFVMLACAPDIGGRSEPLLPRPLALLDANAQTGNIEILYFVAGRGTEILRATASGTRAARLRIIGPLGHGFEPIPNVDVHIALGGGSGVAPLVFFFRRFADAKARGAWRLILAARTAAQLARADVVKIPGELLQATDDGSAGFRGNAVQNLEQLLSGELKSRAVGIYAAGPEAMMEGAARVGQRLGLPVRVSLEGRMACGVGVCRACVVDGVSPHPKTGLMRRTVCQDGPVFDTKELAGWSCG
jgi:dihydroorotate dehydrogenase electron transfer subunit